MPAFASQGSRKRKAADTHAALMNSGDMLGSDSSANTGVRLRRFTLVSRQANIKCVASPVRRSLKKRATNEDPDFEALHEMCCKFTAESPHGGGYVTGGACHREKKVFFIEADEGNNSGTNQDKVIGYLCTSMLEHQIVPNMPEIPEALRQRARECHRSLPSLCQLFVKSEHRRQGIATKAIAQVIRTLSCEALVIEAPVQPTLKAMERLRWRCAGVRGGPEGQPMCLFLPPAHAT